MLYIFSADFKYSTSISIAMNLSKPVASLTRRIVLFMILVIPGTAYAQHDMHGSQTPLTKSGNEIFGTIQEVIQKLEANPNTDWSNVDLEALRQHLLDMKAFTEEVTVLEKTPITKGVKVTIHPNSERAKEALPKLFGMHPRMLKQEKGWDMSAQQDGENWVITCTTEKEADVNKIRALGYIGLLAEGSHHQLHHWMVATNHMQMK